MSYSPDSLLEGQINARDLGGIKAFDGAHIAKNRLVRWEKIIPAIICGCITAVAGTFIARSVGNEYMTKIFSVFVLITGIRELFSKSDN